MSRVEPKIVIAHMPQILGFTDADLDRVASVGTVLDRVPISAWNDSRADALLAAADVVLAHWGCPAIDATVLDRAPNLGLIAYAAGTVKTVVTDAVWTRDIRVTSGAVANAEPVAEFTIAAILWANKDALWRRVHTGQPDRPTTGGVPRGNYGKTIGLVGASLVGRRVIELLALFPDLDVTLYDPFVTSEEAADLGVTKLNRCAKGCQRCCKRVGVISSEQSTQVRCPLCERCKNQRTTRHALRARNTDVNSRADIADMNRPWIQ